MGWEQVVGITGFAVGVVSAFWSWLSVREIRRVQATERRSRDPIAIELVCGGESEVLDYRPARRQVSRAELTGIISAFYEGRDFNTAEFLPLLRADTLQRVADAETSTLRIELSGASRRVFEAIRETNHGRRPSSPKSVAPTAAGSGVPEPPVNVPLVLDVGALFKETGTAKLDQLPSYEAEIVRAAGSGIVVRLTGGGPIWLYLRLAHALHGKARKLVYESPATGEVIVFDHNPR